MNHEFNIIIIGDGGTGKTSFLRRLESGEYNRNYIATLQESKHTVSFKLSGDRQVIINFTDTSGQRYAFENPGGYHGAFVMYSQDDVLSLRHVRSYREKISHHIGNNIPVVVVGNKSDMVRKQVKPEPDFVLMSTRTCIGLEDPLVTMFRILLHDPTVEIETY